NSSGQETATLKNGAPNSGKTDIVEGTSTVVVTSAGGQTVSETITDVGSGLTISSWAATQFDALNRPTRLDHTDGTYTSRDYACCGLSMTRDRFGVVTSYTYDALGRQKTVARDGIVTRTNYDADGRVKSITRIGTDTSEIVLEQND